MVAQAQYRGPAGSCRASRTASGLRGAVACGGRAQPVDGTADGAGRIQQALAGSWSHACISCPSTEKGSRIWALVASCPPAAAPSIPPVQLSNIGAGAVARTLAQAFIHPLVRALMYGTYGDVAACTYVLLLPVCIHFLLAAIFHPACCEHAITLPQRLNLPKPKPTITVGHHQDAAAGLLPGAKPAGLAERRGRLLPAHPNAWGALLSQALQLWAQRPAGPVYRPGRVHAGNTARSSGVLLSAGGLQARAGGARAGPQHVSVFLVERRVWGGSAAEGDARVASSAHDMGGAEVAAHASHLGLHQSQGRDLYLRQAI